MELEIWKSLIQFFDMEANTWNSLIQLTISFLLSLITFYFQFQMVFVSGERRVSNHLRLNILMWTISSAFAIVYSGYFLVFFRGEGESLLQRTFFVE